MKRMVWGSLLLFATTVLGQQQSAPPYNSPPYTPPPTFPQEQRPGQPLPPDTKAPAPRELSNPDVQKQIQHKLATEPLLEDSEIDAAVDDTSVILTGTVDTEEQHKLALRIAESYAGQRRIIDKIQVRS